MKLQIRNRKHSQSVKHMQCQFELFIVAPLFQQQILHHLTAIT